MFTALSNWRFFPASSIRVFSSRVYTRVRARGRRRSSSLSLCVERHPRLWMCVCPHLLASSYVRPGAGTRVDIFTERRIYGVECPNFFIFASLSLNVVVGVRVDVFLFFVCQVSKALYFQKGQNTRFRVQSHSRTRALWTTTTTRLDDDDATWHHHHHLASSSSSFARTEQTVEAWRSIDRFMSRELEGWR